MNTPKRRDWTDRGYFHRVPLLRENSPRNFKPTISYDTAVIFQMGPKAMEEDWNIVCFQLFQLFVPAVEEGSSERRPSPHFGTTFSRYHWTRRPFVGDIVLDRLLCCCIYLLSSRTTLSTRGFLLCMACLVGSQTLITSTFVLLLEQIRDSVQQGRPLTNILNSHLPVGG